MIETGGTTLSLEFFLGIENTEENLEKFSTYPTEKLQEIKQQAVSKEYYEVAGFIRDVLALKNEKMEKENPNANVSEKTDGITADIAKALTSENKDIPTENLNTSHEYLDLYNKQNEIAAKLEKWAEDNNLKDCEGNKLYFSPEYLSFDKIDENTEMIIYSAGMASIQSFLIKSTNGNFENVNILQNKINYDPNSGSGTFCSSIRKIGEKVYSVVFDYMKNHRSQTGREKVSYINEKGEEIKTLGNFGTISKNVFGFYQTEKRENDKLTTTIFDKNFNVLYIIPDKRYHLEYCDDNVCVCINKDQTYPTKYVIFDKEGHVFEGTEKEIEGIEGINGFINKKEEDAKQKKRQEEKEKLPFGEKFFEETHCRINLDEERHTANITNEDGEILYSISNFLEFKEHDSYPTFKTNNGDVFINNWHNKGRILHITECDKSGNFQKIIFINTETGKSIKLNKSNNNRSTSTTSLVIDGGKMIQIRDDENSYMMYDENLDLLGRYVYDWPNEKLCAIKDGNRIYLYSEYTGEKICEIGDIRTTIKRHYLKKDWDVLIIEDVNGNLIEV